MADERQRREIPRLAPGKVEPPPSRSPPPPKSLDRIAGTYSYECHGFCCSLAVWQFKYSGDSRRGNSWFGIITVGIVA